MNDFDAFKQLKAGPIDRKMMGPGSYSKELRQWYDQKFISLAWKITSKFGFSQQVAEEVTQIVLLKAVNNIESIQSEFALKKWINTIIQNTCIDEIRKQTYVDENEAKKEMVDKASIIKVSEINGIKITEYSYIKPNDGTRKLKFDVLYSKLDDEKSKTLEELIEEFASDLDVYEESPEKDLIQKNLVDCVQMSLTEFHHKEPQKAEAIRMLMLDTPNAEIAIKLNKSPKAVREYLSQCYKKFKLFVKPCYEVYKLA